MNNETKHTPLPWRVARAYGDAKYCTIEGSSRTVAKCSESNESVEANAELIVRAVNSHQDLVDALIKTNGAIERILTESQLDTRLSCGRTLREYSISVRAALAKAKQ